MCLWQWQESEALLHLSTERNERAMSTKRKEHASRLDHLLTREDVEALGGLPDNSTSADLGIKIWEKDCHTQDDCEPGFQVVVSFLGEPSIWLECYDKAGIALSLIELDIPATKHALIKLLKAIGNYRP